MTVQVVLTPSAACGRLWTVRPPADGLVEVGSHDPGPRRRHWFRCRPFGVRALDEGAYPALDTAMVREACVSGAWREARELSGGAGLRLPDALLGAAGHHPPRPVTGLSWAEATAFSRCCGGRLPGEREVDLIGEVLSPVMEPGVRVDVWTASAWDPFSYAFCIHDDMSGRWIGAHEESTHESDEVSVLTFENGRCVDRSPRPRHALSGSPILTWVVFDVALAV